MKRVDTIRLLIQALGEMIDDAQKPQVTFAEPIQLGEWCRREQAQKAFGVSPHRLRQMVIEGKVVAKKFEPNEPTSVVVFRTADIRNAIDDMPNYTYGEEK